MSDIIRIDYPDEVIHWFAGVGAGERRRRVIGRCPHDCKHLITAVIAWGPDRPHYELWSCDDVCKGDCRAWCPAPCNYPQIQAMQWAWLAPA